MYLDRPILITGTPRSGKTCVWRILGQSDEFEAINEPIMVWDAGLRRPDDTRTEKDAEAPVVERIRSTCAARLRKSGKPRYLDDLAYHCLRLGFVHAVMPEARVIHMIRDPVDILPELLYGWTYRGKISRTIRSRTKDLDPRALPRLAFRFLRSHISSLRHGRRENWGPAVPGLEQFRKTHSPVEIAAFQWVTMVEIALRDIERLPGLEILTVRYEQLIENPETEAQRIAEFAEVGDPTPCIEYATSTMKRDYVHYEPCKAEMTDADWRAVDPIVRPLQERLNYPPSELQGQDT